jgi:uncharacterized protein
MSTRNYSIAIIILLVIGCSDDRNLGPTPVPENYTEQINDWKEYRISRLTEPTGWLRLADLIWLDEGENSFGSGSDMDIRFPGESMPEHAGTFILTENSVEMIVNDGVTITHNGDPVSSMVIFDGENRPEIEHEDLIWFVDTRGNQHGIRIYNQDTPEADAFEGFPFTRFSRNGISKPGLFPGRKSVQFRLSMFWGIPSNVNPRGGLSL